MPSDSFDHLRFTRLEQVNSKRKKGGFGGVVKPTDPQAHAKKLLDQLEESALDVWSGLSPTVQMACLIGMGPTPSSGTVRPFGLFEWVYRTYVYDVGPRTIRGEHHQVKST